MISLATSIIDTHHHLWQYSEKEYGWISDEMKVIRRSFLPADLKKEIDAAGVRGVVSVQARQTLEESRWLLELADANPKFMLGVVGWVPLIEKDVAKHLERFAANKKFKGVRHVLQDEKDNNYILRPDFNEGVRALKQFKLRYDILIFERHLPQTIKFVDQHKDQPFILDHIAKPKIKAHEISPWRENIKELAKRPNVSCKISGMITEADWKNWKPADLQPYIDTVLEAFGPSRLMIGSDWPVMLVAGGYKQWIDLVVGAISKLSPGEKQQIMGGTALKVYGL